MKSWPKKLVFGLIVCLTIIGNSTISYAWPYKIAPLPVKIQDLFGRRTCGIYGASALVAGIATLSNTNNSEGQASIFSTLCNTAAIGSAILGAELVTYSLFQTSLNDFIQSCYLSKEEMKLRNTSRNEWFKWKKSFPVNHPDPAIRELHNIRRSIVLDYVADQVTDGELEALEDLLQFVDSSDDERNIFCKYRKGKSDQERRNNSEEKKDDVKSNSQSFLSSVWSYFSRENSTSDANHSSREDASFYNKCLQQQHDLRDLITQELSTPHTHAERDAFYKSLNISLKEWHELRSDFQQHVANSLQQFMNQSLRDVQWQEPAERKRTAEAAEKLFKNLMPSILFSGDHNHLTILSQYADQHLRVREALFHELNKESANSDTKVKMMTLQKEQNQINPFVVELNALPYSSEDNLLNKSMPFLKDLYTQGPGAHILEITKFRDLLVNNPELLHPSTLTFFKNMDHRMAFTCLETDSQKEAYILTLAQWENADIFEPNQLRKFLLNNRGLLNDDTDGFFKDEAHRDTLRNLTTYPEKEAYIRDHLKNSN